MIDIVSNVYENEDIVCKICYDKDNLIFPCKCNGTCGGIHRECLDEWLLESSNTKCEICLHEYKYKVYYRCNERVYKNLFNVRLENVENIKPIVISISILYEFSVLFGIIIYILFFRSEITFFNFLIFTYSYILLYSIIISYFIKNKIFIFKLNFIINNLFIFLFTITQLIFAITERYTNCINNNNCKNYDIIYIDIRNALFINIGFIIFNFFIILIHSIEFNMRYKYILEYNK